MIKDFIALVPIKAVSERVPGKNMRSFRANLVENFADFQPYGLEFGEINKLFRLLLAARPRMGAEQFDKVKVKLL